METEFKKIINQISPNINIYDFNTIERSYNYVLRFELGDNLENGTKKRVKQATYRAKKLFESCFSEDDFIYILSFEFQDDFLAMSPNYFYKLIKNKGWSEDKNLALRYFNNEKPEYYPGKISLFMLPKSRIDYPKILEAIANTDMGFCPSISQLIFFFGKRSQKLFWMYDDRGCIICSQLKEDLIQVFSNFKAWLVDGYEEIFKRDTNKIAKF